MNKKLLYGIPLGVLMLGFVIAVASSFHQTPVDLTVNEARSSADLPFSLSCLSGETISHDITIQNEYKYWKNVRSGRIENEYFIIKNSKKCYRDYDVKYR